MNRAILIVICVITGGCATYTTPSGGAAMDMQGLLASGQPGYDPDQTIEAQFSRQPASSLPANIAVIRVQDNGYRTATAYGVGSGRYSVVTTRDIETSEHLAHMNDLPFVQGVAPIGRMLVPATTDSMRDLRLPASQLRADMLLIYTVDTVFHVEDNSIGPSTLISLGIFRDRKAHIASTVAGVLIDVRTGFIYGTAESTALHAQATSVWNKEGIIDEARLSAERQAFDGFVGEFEQLWEGVATGYITRGAARPSKNANRYYTVDFSN